MVEGLALGVLAQGVHAVSSAKLDLEFAFNFAWRRWSQASRFPSIAGHDAGNLFWIGMGKSEGRRSTPAAWRCGRWSEPYIFYDGWTVDECLELVADERASGEDWKEFGQLYVSYFKPDKLRFDVDPDR
ncbi:hypothetical protein C8E86_6030 [Catellatospora citrea]|nr:hypothetical protein C8E86_6030 [Catellatospora citrea]